jgi:hypothetical protein
VIAHPFILADVSADNDVGECGAPSRNEGRHRPVAGLQLSVAAGQLGAAIAAPGSNAVRHMDCNL